ncbi:MAG: hypothetical protein WCO42_08390 [bacterium]
MSPSTTDWDEEVKPVKPKPQPPAPSAVGCLIVASLSVALLFAMVVLGIQTRVGCELVANYLKKQTGLDLTVGGARLTAPLGLILVDVQTKPSTTPLGSFKAREIEVDFRWGGTMDLTLRGMRLELVKIADGWVPTPFVKLGALSDIRETAALFAEDPDVVSVDVTDSTILWSGPDGERLSSVDGLSLNMRPVRLGERRLKVFDVAARSVYRSGGVKGRIVQRLWISVPDNPYLEVEYRGIWEGDEAGAKDWWSTPPGTVKRGSGR